MSTTDQMIYATMIALAFGTLVSLVWFLYKMKTDWQYRREFWEAYEQDRRTREIQQ